MAVNLYILCEKSWKKEKIIISIKFPVLYSGYVSCLMIYFFLAFYICIYFLLYVYWDWICLLYFSPNFSYSTERNWVKIILIYYHFGEIHSNWFIKNVYFCENRKEYSIKSCAATIFSNFSSKWKVSLSSSRIKVSLCRLSYIYYISFWLIAWKIFWFSEKLSDGWWRETLQIFFILFMTLTLIIMGFRLNFLISIAALKTKEAIETKSCLNGIMWGSNTSY